MRRVRTKTAVGDERGSATLVAVAVVGLILVLSMGVADLGRVLIARSRARTAADAGALAAVQELALPSGLDPSAAARDYVERNGAVMVACTCAAGTAEAVVTATIDPGPLLLAPGAHLVTATARAVVDPAGGP